MANGGTETHRHFILEGFTETERYRSRRSGSSSPVLPQDPRGTRGDAPQRPVCQLLGSMTGCSRHPLDGI